MSFYVSFLFGPETCSWYSSSSFYTRCYHRASTRHTRVELINVSGPSLYIAERDKKMKSCFKDAFYLHLRHHNTSSDFTSFRKWISPWTSPKRNARTRRQDFSAIGYNSVLLPSPPICYLTAVRKEKKNT